MPGAHDAGADLHLALKLDRLHVDHDRQPGLAPGIESALDDVGFAALASFAASAAALLRCGRRYGSGR